MINSWFGLHVSIVIIKARIQNVRKIEKKKITFFSDYFQIKAHKLGKRERNKKVAKNTNMIKIIAKKHFRISLTNISTNQLNTISAESC